MIFITYLDYLLSLANIVDVETWNAFQEIDKMSELRASIVGWTENVHAREAGFDLEKIITKEVQALFFPPDYVTDDKYRDMVHRKVSDHFSGDLEINYGDPQLLMELYEIAVAKEVLDCEKYLLSLRSYKYGLREVIIQIDENRINDESGVTPYGILLSKLGNEYPEIKFVSNKKHSRWIVKDELNKLQQLYAFNGRKFDAKVLQNLTEQWFHLGELMDGQEKKVNAMAKLGIASWDPLRDGMDAIAYIQFFYKKGISEFLYLVLKHNQHCLGSEGKIANRRLHLNGRIS